MKKTIIVLILFAVLCATACAQNASDFKTDGKGAIIGYNGKEKNVVIPSKIGKENITAIGKEAFYHKELNGVTIPNSVKFIGDWAFMGNLLTSITIGANVELEVSPGAECSCVFDYHYDFDYVYTINGNKAGTYTLSNAESKEWSRK